MNNYQFINPYNFIPLPEQCNRIHKNEPACYTGYIQCQLTTLTPLIMIDSVEGTEDSNVKEHMVYRDTYMLNNRPAIPASSLRGMIRNKFEVLTSSCTSSAEEDLAFFGRYNGNMTYPGILDLSDPNDYKLYKCNKYPLRYTEFRNDLRNKKNGDKLSFNIGRVEDKLVVTSISNRGTHHGYLKIGEKFGHRTAYHIFEKTNSTIDATNKNDFKRMYDEICETYYDNLGNQNHHSKCNSNLKLVWYENIDGYVYFSLGQNGQTKYRHHYKDIVPKSTLPCNDINNLCEACTLFGTVNNTVKTNSKIRFEDARLISNTKNYYQTKNAFVLEELASPQYSNPYFYFQFYQNDELFNGNGYVWNSDFYKRNLRNQNSIPINDGCIQARGRKEYWHHQPIIKDNIEKTKRNVSVRPLKTNLVYSFKVYFNNITKTQLEHLHMALCLGNNSDYAHKLGLGKPLGYGSVKIKTTNIIYKNIEYKNNTFTYKLQKYTPTHATIEDTFDTLDTIQLFAIKQMYSFSFLAKQHHQVPVDYPRNYPNGKIYEWFGASRGQGDESLLPFSDYEYDYLIQHGMR